MMTVWCGIVNSYFPSSAYIIDTGKRWYEMVSFAGSAIVMHCFKRSPICYVMCIKVRMYTWNRWCPVLCVVRGITVYYNWNLTARVPSLSCVQAVKSPLISNTIFVWMGNKLFAIPYHNKNQKNTFHLHFFISKHQLHSSVLQYVHTVCFLSTLLWQTFP